MKRILENNAIKSSFKAPIGQKYPPPPPPPIYHFWRRMGMKTQHLTITLLLLAALLPQEAKAQTASISISSMSANEGAEGSNAVAATVTVSLTSTPSEQIRATICFSGTATERDDYRVINLNNTNELGVRSDDANSECDNKSDRAFSRFMTTTQTSDSFRIQLIGDNTIENDEAIVATLVQLEGNNIDLDISPTAGSVTFTIENDDFPTANFAAASSTADEDDGTVTVTVNLSENAIMNTDVAYSVSGTAASATDFSALSNTVQITSGTKTANISIPIIDDEADEPNETIVLTLSNGTGYKVGTPSVHTLTINDDDASPSITSLTTKSVAENTTNVLTVSATDADGDNLTYTVTAGADSVRFRIDQSDGDLTFKTTPDFETPGSADNDNVYEVIVTASDRTNSATQTITVTVTDVNEPPVIAPQTFSIAENTAAGTTVGTVVATDEDAGDNLIFSITSGNLSDAFAINENTGVITVAGTIDHETTPTYTLTVQVSDSDLSANATVTVNVTNVNDNDPMITSPATASVVENTTAVLTVTATDADAGTTLTYSISGGTDRALFSINRTSGGLAFAVAPDFEAPGSADNNNVYEVEVMASDGTNSDTQTITITVTNDPSDDILGFSEDEAKAVIFPNPSGDYLEVRSPIGGVFKILSLSGKRLLEGTTNTKTNVTSLQSGLYLVKLPDGHLLKFVRE